MLSDKFYNPDQDNKFHLKFQYENFNCVHLCGPRIPTIQLLAASDPEKVPQCNEAST